MAYKLKLPERLSNVHDVFHVSQLRKCLQVPEEQVVPDTLDLQDVIPRSAHKNIRYHDQKNSDESHQSLQGTMESSLRS
jgi:hypothetical protein